MEREALAVVTLLAFILMPVFGMAVVLAYGIAVVVYRIVKR